MSEYEIYSIIAVALMICFANWRAGVYISLVAGFLQDPIRKVVPGEPVYFTVLAGIFVGVTFLGAYSRGVRLNFRAIHAWNSVIRTPLKVFVAFVVIQSLMAYFRTGSIILAGIGLLAYLTPFPAILLAYQFSRNEQDVIKFVRVYLAISLLMISGIYLSYLGYDWPTLHTVGNDLIAYLPSIGRLKLYSGFFRAPEVAAWHAGTAVCVVILMVLAIQGHIFIKLAIGLLVPFLSYAILLTGRRKILMEVFLFFSVYAILLVWFRKGAFKSAIALGVIAVASFFTYTYFVPDKVNSGLQIYYERGATVQSDSSERFYNMTFESFQYVIEQNGIWGAGAGTGSQGAQHFGGGTQIVGYAAEGGLAKVLAELGIPGLILLLWLAINTARYIWSIIVYVKDGEPARARMTFGMLAFLVANSFVYMIAHQIFGDLFVLIILGFVLGFTMAVPKMGAVPVALPDRGFIPQIMQPQISNRSAMRE